MSTKARVLIVDASQESREVLRALLERNGTDTVEATHNQAAEFAHRFQPDLILCDSDGDRSPAGEATHLLTQQASRSAIPIVVLGTVQRDLIPLARGSVVSKPYHYAPLVRKIEQLLETRG